MQIHIKSFQAHLVLRIRQEKDKEQGVKTQAAHETLRRNFDKLVSKLAVEDILPKLFAKKIIGEYERQMIQAGKTQLGRSEALAESLLRKSGKQFEQFCRIVEDNQVFAEFARSLRSQYEEEIAVIQGRKGRRVVKQPVEAPSEKVSSPPHITAVASSGKEVLSEYDSLTVDQCDRIVNKLQSSLQIVDMSVIAQALNEDRILTPEEFARLQDRFLPNRQRWLLAALRRTRMPGLKSLHRALETTSRTAPQHMEVLAVLVDKVEEVTRVKIAQSAGSLQEGIPLMKLVVQSPEWPPSSGSGGIRKQSGQEGLDLGFEESSKESAQAPHPPPPGQEHLQPHQLPSTHYSSPAPVSPPSSIGLGGGASARQQPRQEGPGMSERRQPQSQPAAPRHVRPATGPQPKDSSDVSEEGKMQLASLPRPSHSPKPKRSKSGNGATKLDVINSTLLKACVDGKEDAIENIIKFSRPELNVACLDEAGLSPLHYAVKIKLRKSLRVMVQHATFTLAVTDKDGRTPLHYAAMEGDRELLLLLNRPNHETLSGGDSGLEDLSPQNIQDKAGNTALHLAVEAAHIYIVKSLVVVFKCSLIIANNEGLKPVHLATNKVNFDIVKFLMKHEHSLEEDTHSHYSTASEGETGDVSAKKEASEWSSSEYVENISGGGDKSLVSTEQEGGSAWGSSEMLVGSGTTPTTSALYGLLQLKGDKMNKTRMEVRSAAVLTGPQERSLMEYKEQARVLRERLDNTQKKMAHLETEIQQHHIREALRQAHLHPSEDEEADRRKYSSYRHEDLVEELLYVKSFVQKFEVVASESKAVAQRFSADLEAEKAANQALRDNSDVSRSLWEKRIRDLSTTIKRRDEKIAELELKIESLKKKKGKEKAEERDELAGPLQRILREGAGIIMYRHSQTLQQHQQERQAHEEMMAQTRRQQHPQALPWKDTSSPSASLQQERPSPLGTGQDSEPAGAVTMTTQPGSFRMVSTSSKLSVGSVQSANQFLQLLLRNATAQVHTASVVVVESSAKTVTTAILQSAIEGRVKGVVLTPPLECVSMTISASSTESAHLVGPFPPSFTTDLRILGLLQNEACGLLAEVLPSLVDPASLPSTLQGTAARESLQQAAAAKLLQVQNAVHPFQQIDMAQISAKVVTKALTRLHSSSAKLPAVTASPNPVMQTVLTIPSLPDESSYTAVSRLLPLLMPPSTMCMLRVLDRNDIVARMSALRAFYDPAVKEFLEHLVTTDVPEVEGARVVLGEIQKDEMPSMPIKQQIEALRQYVSTTEHPKAIGSEDFALPESLTSPASKEMLQNGLKVLQSLSADSLPVQLVPVRWLLLLDVLTEAALQCVDLATVEQIASSICRMSSTEVQLALVRLTELGHLMFFPQSEKLSAVVIVDRSAVATALLRLSQLKTEAPPQYLPSTVHGVVEECLLHSSLDGLSVPAEVLTNLLEHLCIIGQTALTTAPFPLLHAQCRVFIVPALLPTVMLKPPMRAEVPSLRPPAPHGSKLDRPSSPFSPDTLATSSLQQQEEPLVILSRSRVLLTTFIPALCRSLSASPIYSSSGMYLVHDAAFNQICIKPHPDVQLSVQVFETHSNIFGSHSGIKVDVGPSADQHLEPVIRHLLHAVSLVEEAYGPVGVEWTTPCLQVSDPPHPLKLSANFRVSSGRVITQCEVCGAEVTTGNLQRLMMECYTKISSEKPTVGGSVLLADSAPSSAVSLSEVTQVIESLGEGVGWEQVRQLAQRLGFTQTEVTSLEQVAGGGGSASTMLLHVLLVWQKQKSRSREGGREELAAALSEGGLRDAAGKVDNRLLERERQPSSAQLFSPALEDFELHLVSSHVGKNWEQLAASLGFRDIDDPEFSDRSGEEACRMMLTQWRREHRGRNARLALSVALKGLNLGLDLLSERIQAAAETRSRSASSRIEHEMLS